MADAPRDNNFQKTLLAASNADGSTPVVLWADPTTHRLLMDANVTVTLNSEYAEDTAHQDGDSGQYLLAVRKDTPANLSGTDGDYEGLQVSGGLLWVRAKGMLTPNGDSMVDDTNDSLNVTIVSGAASGTEYNEDAATPATIVGGAVMMERDDALTTVTPIEGDWIGLRGTAEGALWVQDFNSDAILTAAQAIQTAVEGTLTVGSHAVTNAGTFAVQVDGNALTALQLIDDIVATDDGAVTPASQKVAMVGYVFDDTTPDSVDEGDGGYARMSSRREVYFQLRDAAGGERGANVDASNRLTVVADLGSVDNAVLDNIDTNTGNAATALAIIDDWDNAASDGASVSGDVAHDAADAGEPVKIGGKAQDHLSAPTEVSAANDRVNALLDRVGRVGVYQGYVLKSAVINHSTSGDNTIVAAVTGKKIRVIAVAIVSDGTTDVRWESGASGTALTGQIPLQAREGYTISNPWGLFETASNTLLNLELTAAINVHGFVTYLEVDD